MPGLARATTFACWTTASARDDQESFSDSTLDLDSHLAVSSPGARWLRVGTEEQNAAAAPLRRPARQLMVCHRRRGRSIASSASNWSPLLPRRVLGPGWASNAQEGRNRRRPFAHCVRQRRDQDDFHCADFEPLGCKRRRLEPAQWSGSSRPLGDHHAGPDGLGVSGKDRRIFTLEGQTRASRAVSDRMQAR
jgi:hypothetical protein